MKKSINIKAVIFDAGGVLVGLSPAVEDIKQEFNILSQGDEMNLIRLLRRHEKGEITAKEFWRLFKNKFKITARIPTPSPLIRRYQKEVEIDQSVLAIANSVRNQGIITAILSDTNPAHIKHLKRIGLLHHFKKTIASYQVQSIKPQRKIFLIALRILQVSPNETIFVDDKLTNVNMARRIGMHGILFKNADQLKRELTNLGLKP